MPRNVNRPAEQAVLGAMMRDSTLIGEVLTLVRCDEFSTDAHQKVFSAAVALWEEASPPTRSPWPSC